MKNSTVFVLIFVAGLALIALSLSTAPAQPNDVPAAASSEVPVAAPDAPVAAPPAAPDVNAPVPVPEQPGEVVGLLGKLLQAAKSGNWGLVFVLTVMIFVWGVRAISGRVKALKWFTTKWGGWSLVLAGTTAGALATALLADQGISWSLVSNAITIGLAAAAAHELHKDSGLKGG